MRKKVDNKETISGRIYEHTLVKKVVERADSPNKGTEFITGTVSVATDEDIMNIIEVHYTYVTEISKTGKKNSTYAVLNKILEEGKTVLADGKDEAMLVQLTPSLALNDFYTSRNGDEQLVSAKRNEGGFASFIKALPEKENQRAVFELDVLISGARLVEADPEKNIDEDYMILKCYAFDFRKAILPVELIARDPRAIKYFENLELSSSNPLFTKVKGQLKSRTDVTKIEEASAFGEPSVKEFTKSTKEWVVTWAQEVPYELGDSENGITADDIKQALADRELYLAGVKKRQDEWQATKNAVKSTPLTAAEGAFDFLS